MRHSALLLIILLALCRIAIGQKANSAQPVCGTMQHYQWMMQQDPSYEQNIQQIENFTQGIIAKMQKADSSQKNLPPVYIIPVVFHVVWNTSSENISDARCVEQLNVLNEDFRRLNADASNTPSVFQSVAADAEIQFCLAQRDPNGNSTTGVIHKNTSQTSFSTNDAVKFNSQGGDNAWPCGDYLNIWVCDLGSSLLGYAQFPGGSCNTDGVVLHYKYTGKTGAVVPFHLGRTGTHEVGHWVNLRHIWGDANCGNDLVSDTPTQDNEHYNCPTHPLHTNACGGGSSPNGEMFMNYMDYVDDDCMNMFTSGQRTRMRTLFNSGGQRYSLLSSQGCVSPVALDAAISAIVSPPSGSFCATSITPVVTLKNYGSTTLTSVQIKYQLDAGPVNTYSWTGTLASGLTTNVTLPSMAVSAGAHTFTSYTNLPNGSADQNPANDQSSVSFTITTPPAGTATPVWQGFQLATFPPTGWTLVNGGDPSYTWARYVGTGGFDTSTACTRMDNYSSNTSIAGDVDALETFTVTFASVSAPVRLDFSVAYSRYNSSLYDRLKVYYSTDCGGAWVSIYDKQSTTLATAPDNTNGFVPTPTQWRRESVNIDALAGNSNVKFRFENISGWGNYLYIDDINLYGTVSVTPPVANFTASSTTVCQGQTVTFTDLSTNSPTSWSWTINGGTPSASTLQNPTATFNTAGTYTISLTATNGGGSDPEVKTNYIIVNQAATAGAGADATICAGSAYTLSGTRGGSASSSTWTTSGTGTFDNASLLAATYTPSASDITMGGVTLTLTTNDPDGAGPCAAAGDAMTLTINQAATANAGIDVTICSGSTYTLSGTIGGSAASATWTTSGTGVFSNPNSLTATYTPSAADITMGMVTLTLTTNDPAGPCPAVTDQMVITINPAATANAGADAAICAGNAYTLSGAIGGSAASGTWTSSGSGTFNNPVSLTATYTPSATDITMGNVTLTLTTNDPAGPCLSVSDAMVLTINQAATANAGADAAVCAGSAYTLAGTIGGGATSATWTSSGTGTFNNPNSLTATYTPSAADITAGSVTLTLTSNDPAGPCPSVNDVMVLSINQPATANAGADAVICAGTSYTLSGSRGGSATNSAWTTSGTGTFDNSSLLTAAYTPSSNDISMGSVTLTLTTNDPAGPCSSASDFMILTINVLATANAGPDAVICAGNTFSVAGATIGGSASSQTWASSGTGIFNNSSLLNPTYTPSASDITAGTVNLTITSNDPSGPCPAVSDFMVLTINQPATVNAGSDATICAGNTYTLSGTRGGSASSSTWTTSGSGTFDNASLLAATYTPSGSDIAMGSITLTLTTNDPAGPCPAVPDQMALTVNTAATAYAGTDAEICAGNTYTLSGSVGGGASSGSWLTTGSGTFDNNALLNATYTPSAGDVAAGSVKLILTSNDPAGPCASATDTLTLAINPLPSVTVSGTNINCNGGNNGTATATGSGGTPTYSYYWNSTPPQTNSTSTGLAAGTYNITLTDSKGCSVIGSIAITQPSSISYSASSVNASCGSNNGSASVTVGGGTPPYSYLWDAAAVNQTTSTATGLGAGNYSVTITDNNGCTAATSVSVNSSNLTLSTGSVSDNFCYGQCNGTATATASGGNPAYTYNWSDGETGATAVSLCSGIQSVTVADDDGCIATVSLTITQPPALIISNIKSDVSCNGAGDGTILSTVSGGVPFYSYQWDATAGGQTTSNATGLGPGIYSMTVTDNNGCTLTTSDSINEPFALITSIDSIIDEQCSGTSNGMAAVTEGGGTSPYTYQWSNGATTAIAGNLQASTYYVTVSDANGCTATGSAVIGISSALTASVTAVVNASCSGASDGFATVTPASGNPPYSFLWSDGQTNSTASGLSQGLYSVTVTDFTGCTASDSVAISASGTLAASISSVNNVTCFGDVTGSASVSTSGGNLPYTYLWSDNQTASTAGALGASTYFVTVSDNSGCSIVLPATITQPGQIILAASSANASCGFSNGSATVNASGGISPYTYNWNDLSSQTTSSATGLNSGNYSVTVADNNGCSASAPVLVNNDIPVISIYTFTNVTCAGSCNGTASTSIGGGVGPYTYLWTNGETGGSALSLCSGFAGVTLTDGNGCITSDTVFLTEPTPVNASFTVTNAISCFGANDGELTVTTAGGISPYTYFWDSLSGFQTNAIATGLPVGAHAVTIYDFDSCAVTVSYTLTQPAQLTVSTSSVNATCGTPDGSASASANGGMIPYTYQWDAATGGQTGSAATGLSAGSYYVTVTDFNGCTRSASSIVNNTIPMVAVDSIMDASCSDACDGRAGVTATGGDSPYTFLWDNGETNFYAVNLCPGQHVITVVDSNGCISSASPYVNSPDTLNISIIFVKNVSCNGYSDAIISASATGGTSPYSFQWNDGMLQTTPSATGLTQGNYSLTVTDNRGCTATGTQSISEPAALTVSVSSTDAACGNANGTATAIPAGGTGPYTYFWSPGGSTASTVTGLFAANYNITVTDASGCTAGASVTVQNSNFSAFIASASNATCSGLCDGSASIATSGGTAPFSFLWDNGETINPANNLCAGNHIVTVTDANNCMTTAGITIAESVSLTANVAAYGDVTCWSSADGYIAVNITGGSTPYSYLWNDANQQTSATATGLGGGNYQVTATDANGCTVSIAQLLSEPAELALSVSVTNALCGQANGTATASVTGGSPQYSYIWNIGQTASTATGLSAGAYYVTASDINGCSSSGSNNVNNDIPVVNSISSTNVTCFGSCDGTASVNISGGTVPYTYIWNNGSSLSAVNSLCPGIYLVTIYDAGNCITTAGVNITQPAPIALTLISTQDLQCGGDANGTAAVNATGGTLPYSYQWDSQTGNQTTITATGLNGSIYSVTVTDAVGCSASLDSIIINEPPALVLDITPDNVTCPGAGNGAADAEITGGVSPYTYNWSNGDTTEDIFGLQEGTYSVTVTDRNNCTLTGNVTITVPASAISVTDTVTPVMCSDSANGAIDITVTGGTPPYFYFWSNGAATEDISGLDSGIYSVIITDINECVTFYSDTIGKPLPLIMLLSGTNITCSGAGDGAAAVSVTGGASPYSYLWNTSPGQTTSAINNLSPDKYYITVTDNYGCSKTGTVFIAEPQPMSISIYHTDAFCNGICNGTALAVVSGGNAGYSYLWNGSAGYQTGQSATGLCAGAVTLTVGDANNCTITGTAETGYGFNLEISRNILPASCDDASDGKIDITVSGGKLPLAYYWNTGATDEDLNGIDSGKYIVTVKDSNNCMITDTIEVGVGGGDCFIIYDAFSPNEDGSNDVWNIKGIDNYPDANVEVFNRWGSLVYKSTPFKPWDGKYEGKDMPEGVYYYIVTVPGKENYTGTVTIVR